MHKVNIEPFNLIGIAIRTTNQNGKAAKEIANLWQEFLGKNIIDNIPNLIDPTVYSLYTDYEGDHNQPYTAMIGCKVSSLSEIPNEMVGKTFEGGTYVKTSAKGDLMEGLIVRKWNEIWDMKLDRIYTADFEVFGEKAQDPRNAEIDFYIAINK